MKNAIVTGFEPFGNYKNNPTQDIAKLLDGREIGGFNVTGLVLPCTYYGASEALAEKIDKLNPEVVLGCGLSSSVPKMRLEAITRNMMHGKYADANGFFPRNQKINKLGRESHELNSDSIR